MSNSTYCEDEWWPDKEESSKEEPVSEDLEEAAWLYYDKNRLPIPPEWDLHKEFIDFFKAGAKWQKQKATITVNNELETEIDNIRKKYQGFESLCEHDVIEICEHFFKFGTEWQKQQMMKSAVEGTVEEPECLWWRIISDDLEGEFVVKNDLHDGDRVKLVVIKEE